ncbi:MAG: response regulator [Betaproteobacteria bacterium]|nr:response regulator [Betaproteobacteria bacterium]
MKILILEDEDDKNDEIQKEIHQTISDAEIQRVRNWYDYTLAISNTKFDLILLDLLVPRSGKDETVEDHHSQLVLTTRDYQSRSFFTPAIVLTRYTETSGDFVYDLNKVDINVIPFNGHGGWKEALKIKLLAAQPKKKYEFVIVCALDKEIAAFEDLTDSCGPVKTISGLVCREVQIGAYKGVIVRTHRMGLVAAAIVATMSLERFEPRLICMSGICGGVPGGSGIYDLLVTQICHQHDAGKWSNEGFKSEHYDVQIDVDVHNKLLELCSDANVKEYLLRNLNAGKSELPLEMERLTCNIHTDAPTSSGSAVIAQDGKTSSLASGQRKLAGFDMEIYSIYEAARHATNKPVFFAAKTVVDDGGNNKGDQFHRIGCLLSAKFVIKAIQSGIADIGMRRSRQ